MNPDRHSESPAMAAAAKPLAELERWLQDRADRRERYVEIQKILAEDVPYFWIIDSEGLRAYRTAFTGFRLWTGAFVETVRRADTGQ